MAYNYTNPFANQTLVPGSVGWSPNYGGNPLPNSVNVYQQNDLIFVLDENAARSYPVANGQKVTLWDKNYPKFYIKSVDQNGIPSFRKFSFTEETEQPAIETPKTVTDEYVTKADFDAFANKILDKLNERHNYKKPQQNKEST
jgi:hypothetical protein